MKRHISLITLLVAAIVIPSVSTVSAAGFGIGGAPDYEVSSDYEGLPVPFLRTGESAFAAGKVASMISP